MNIIIIGCGNVGITLARILTEEKHNVVMIDKNPAKLSRMEDIDALSLCGNGGRSEGSGS